MKIYPSFYMNLRRICNERIVDRDGDFLAVSSSEIYIPHQIQNKAMGVTGILSLILPEVLKNLKQF